MKQYDLLFEDEVQFIKSALLPGSDNFEFETAEVRPPDAVYAICNRTCGDASWGRVCLPVSSRSSVVFILVTMPAVYVHVCTHRSSASERPRREQAKPSQRGRRSWLTEPHCLSMLTGDRLPDWV